tara:strand:+ start:24 stop:290 length:267 start_codon:yes stop_codon:yes gene_type:complete
MSATGLDRENLAYAFAMSTCPPNGHQDLSNRAQKIVANSGFSDATNNRLMEATDGGPLDAGLQWEVMESEGHGPDMHQRIAAFTGKDK